METTLFSRRYECAEYFYLEKQIHEVGGNCTMRKSHHPHIFRMIKPKNTRWTTHVDLTVKIKYVQFDGKTLSELHLMFFEPEFPAGAKKLSCSPKLQDQLWCPPSLVFSI
jgi:hypothetical protein